MKKLLLPAIIATAFTANAFAGEDNSYDHSADTKDLYNDNNAVIQDYEKDSEEYRHDIDTKYFLTRTEDDVEKKELEVDVYRTTIVAVPTERVLESDKGLTVFFDFDSADLTAMQKSKIRNFAKTTMQNYSLDSIDEIEVEGHTDAIGSDAYNRQLSERRAEAVQAVIASTNLDEPLENIPMEKQALGESQPIATNSTAAGRELNRRVEITIAAEDQVASR